ncbi:MAG: LysR family transcriptional regulator [Ruminiclostridium sp.]|nr:LysR family transcriptional regulator [Ruminiclostridium sp.]
MNITNLKYAVEIAKAGSMSKAAERLMIAPPNLTRAINELEASLDLRIFERSTKGVKLTPEGEELIRRSANVLYQINEIQQIHRNYSRAMKRFAASVPRASYICEAFRELTLSTDDLPHEFIYRETNSIQTLESVIDCTSDIGIIRSEKTYERFFDEYINNKRLSGKIISEYRYVIVASPESPLAKLEKVTETDLMQLTEIAFSDHSVPYIPSDAVIKTETASKIKRHIYVTDVMNAYLVIMSNPKTFVLLPPMAEDTVRKAGIIQLKYADSAAVNKDILVWRKGYEFTDMDRKFIDAVYKKAEECGIITAGSL